MWDRGYMVTKLYFKKLERKRLSMTQNEAENNIKNDIK
jgi:hypothetical protein